MMKNIFLLIIVVSSIFLFGCSKTVEYRNCDCENMGYVSVDTANKVVNVTNQLVDIANICFAEKNITPLVYLQYFD